MVSRGPKTIAVTGASGHLGTCLVQMLANHGFQVFGQYKSYLPKVEASNINWVQGDINDLAFVKKLIKSADTVVHSAGMVSIADQDNGLLYKVNAEGTSNIVNTCLNKANIKLIHISSSNAVLPPEKSEEVFDENRPYNDLGTPYAISKAAAEKIVLKAVEIHGLNACILRPSAIVGPPDFHPSLMGSSLIDFYYNKYKIIPSGGYNCVDVRDVCQTIINALEKGKKGEIYHVTGSFHTMQDITTILSELTGSKKPWCTIPTDILFPFVPIMSLVSALTGTPQKITKNSLATLKYGPKHMTYQKAKTALGHESRPLNETLHDLIDWFKKQKMIQ